MKILVTGGAGFIGSHFVDLLLSDQEIAKDISKITVLDKLTYAGDLKFLSEARKSSKFHFIQGDICDPNLISNKEFKKLDWIINFAAESHVDRSLFGAGEFVNTNVLGTVNLLNMALENSVAHFLQISTDEVYGSILEGTWDEESKLDPRSPYSASKASAELICNSFFVTHNIDVRITRSSNNFGPRQNLEKMVPKIIYSLINNVPIPVYGNGLNVRDWVYVKDNCIGIWKTMMGGKPGQIYNLGGENEISNLELITSIADLFNIVKPKIQFVEDRKGHDFRYSMSSNKAARQIGYIPSKDFKTGLKETVEYYKNSLK